MYNFRGNEEWKNRFLESVENGDVQKIKGTIKRVDGIIINLDESNLLDDVRCDSQCTENEEVFNFGEMYVGSAEIKVRLSDENTNLIKNGELKLHFGTTEDIWIPLGVWDIVSVERESGDLMTIKGYDHLNRLNKPVTSNIVGKIPIRDVLRQVTKDAGVEFAQTVEEIQKLTSDLLDLTSENRAYGTKFLDTCWNEVKTIAQLIGGFAFANREGKIEFRKFSSTPVLTIPAEKRFSAKISDYIYNVRNVSYTDIYGNTVTYTRNRDHIAQLGFSDNKYIRETEKDTSSAYHQNLRYLANTFHYSWTPGTIEYYGNPALDVGDMVSIEGGVNGENKSSNFLITHISWQFRGPQTLVSAGIQETGTVVSSGNSSGGAVTSYTTVNTTSNISVVELRTYTGEVFGSERMVAKGGFSSCRETWVFIDCTLIISGDGLISTAVYLNGIAQALCPKTTLHNGEFSTLHFNLPVNVSGGTHQVRISVCGNADIADIQAFVWGQEVTEESPEITNENDYIYIVGNGLTTVVDYIGKSLYPQIPDDLGGGKTQYIEKNSFTDSEIESVYIPDGVTEIR
ncbi:MAG: hypothetical protein K2I06_07050 [Ruminococcus sp.]|nr:hypothetical protein [Ruminococcus sp.]